MTNKIYYNLAQQLVDGKIDEKEFMKNVLHEMVYDPRISLDNYGDLV